MNFPGDPLDWSIDEVVNALCTSTSWWREGRPNTFLPDPTSLEQILREQEINGFALLTYFDSEQKLRDDLGIKTVGRRSAVSWAIDKLREQSQKYAEHLVTQRFISSGVSVAQSLSGSAVPSVAGSQASYVRPTVGWLGSLPPPFDHLRTGLATPTHESNLPTVLEAEEITDEHTAGPDEPPVASAKRPGEQVVQDANGRKRRKLTLVEPVAEPRPALESRKVQPNVISSSRSKFPVDKIFYGDATFGQVLEDDDNLGVRHHGEAPADVGPYVYRQFVHFARNSERKELSRSGKKIIAVYPYRASVLPQNHPRSATVIESTDSGPKATRQNALRLQDSTLFDSSAPYEDEDSHELYALVEKWATDKDEVLPALGESDNEDYSSSYEAELEAEERERALQQMKREQLSKEEVAMIVDQRVQELVENWKRKKLPQRQRTARAIWNKGKGRRDRLMLRTAAAERAQRIGNRLSKLREAILDEIWPKKADVLRQCATLEESIAQKEEELWKMSVWNLKAQPARASPINIPKRTMKKSVEDNDKILGEEPGDWVNSESEFESDGLGDFLEVDEYIKETPPNTSPAVTAPESFGHSGDTKDELNVVNMANISDNEPYSSDDNDMVDLQTTATESAVPLPVTPRIPRASKPESAPGSTHSIIDLTALSDGSAQLSPTPVPRSSLPGSSAATNIRSSISLSRTNPEDSTIAEISKWDFQLLEERDDKKRIVLKIVRTIITLKEYARLREYVTSVTKKMLNDQIMQAMGAVRRGERLSGMALKEWDALSQLVRLYVCWNKARQKHWTNPVNILAPLLPRIMERMQTPALKRDFEAFIAFVSAIFQKYPSRKSGSVSVEPTSDDDDEPEPTDTPHKKRKNKVTQSTTAINLRKNAQKRAEAQVEKEREFQERVSSSQSKADRLLVNPGEYGKAGAIYIHQSIGDRIKNHQIEGVKFMWREIVEAGHTDPQGCLLAHTMGLGKTMQAITLLVTIAEAAKSPDEHIRSCIPKKLRRLQALILCPASLVDNWMDELYQWIPKSMESKMGKVRQINAEDGLQKRLTKIKYWDQKGGILVLSYEMFRSLFNEKQASKLSEEERENFQKRLFQGPSIIIADEAHKMKNSNSSLRSLVEQFSSKSRVALTGSPLANNLIEYWSMIDWISPGYLGSHKEFRAYLVEPIEEGLYKDSTNYEHRKALKKLRVLKNEIGPKINRADITVLKDDLKPKVEFLITVPLSPLQDGLYKLCSQYFLGKNKVTTTRLWQWMHLLSTLCNHPAAFFKVLKDVRGQRNNVDHDTLDESEGNELQDNSADELIQVPDESQDLPSSLIEQAMSLWNGTADQESPRHSFKTSILMRILEASKTAGDRVLLFSHHLKTLDYLEDLLARQNHRFVRLDGKTRMSNRPELLEKFNRGDYDIFLISTRAGGTGFNLPGANRVIIFDFGFNPQNEEQAIGRAYRLGQEKEVFVYRMLIGGTFEPKVWNKALFKTQLASRVIDTKNPERHAEKMKDYFFEPQPVQQEDLSEHQGKDRKVLDKILASRERGDDSGIRAIITTETLMTEDLDAVLDEEENEEVKKMIEAERLRKGDPKAWEQYLKDNPMIDDTKNNLGHPLQKALFQDAAARNGPATIPPIQSPQYETKQYVEFGGPVSSTAPAKLGRPAHDAAYRSDGLSSSEAGINNAGPSPASMRRHVPLQPAARKAFDTSTRKAPEPGPRRVAEDPVKEAGEPLLETAKESSAPRERLELDVQDALGSLELGNNLHSDPGVNNTGPALPGARPLEISLISSSPAARRALPSEADQATASDQSDRPAYGLHPLRDSRATQRGQFMSSTKAYNNSTSTLPTRSLTAPLNREVTPQPRRGGSQANRRFLTPIARRRNDRLGSQRPTPPSKDRRREAVIDLSDYSD